MVTETSDDDSEATYIPDPPATDPDWVDENYLRGPSGYDY